MWKVSILGIALLLICTSSAEANVGVNVTYDIILQEEHPVRKTVYYEGFSAGFYIRGNIVSFNSGSGKYTSSGHLNDSLEAINKAGVHYIVRYTYNNNIIIENQTFPSYVIKITIRSVGNNMCNANVEYHRLKGYKYFLDPLDSSVMNSDIKAENIICKLTP